MELSKYNIVSRIKDSNEYFIVNPLYGSADILDLDTYRKLEEGEAEDPEFVKRGYLVDPDVEKARFREAYLQFLDEREEDEIQLFFVPGYNCNFNCAYCYQEGYEVTGTVIRPGITTAFFDYVDSVFSDRRKYVTLFGGEPLLPGSAHKSMISDFVEVAAKRKIDVAVVTNGYLVDDYIEILKSGNIREVQITLDGTRAVHNRRRRLKNGNDSFDRIVKGIDLLLGHDINVNLRVVIDKENISNLPDLAKFAIEKGWTTSPFFVTQLGRNYELHECQSDRARVFSRLEMYNELYHLIREYPHIVDFHRPSFSISRYLFENGELPAPLFDACTGAKTEWAFDYTGNIYACTATVGKKGEELGTFFPERVLFEEKIDEWSERDILSIKECRSCNLNLLCGGGCAAVAKSRNGIHCSPDCRPVKELLDLGISSYFHDHTG